MNRTISTLLATFFIGNIILPTASDARTLGARQPSFKAIATNQTPAQPSPFDLAYLAYQGNFKGQGIPSYGALIDAIAFRNVTAQRLAQAAVKAGRLPEQTLTDRGYLSALQLQLNGFLNR